MTGGTNEGVMGFVGEAVKEYKTTLNASSQPIVALGIATWGIIDNKERLVGSSVRHKYFTREVSRTLNFV